MDDKTNLVVNFHVIDPRNIGDTLSAPVLYFKFPGAEIRQVDLREIAKFAEDFPSLKQKYDRFLFIVGGGGLLFQRFLANFQQIRSLAHQNNDRVKLISWGIGQQNYKLNQPLTTYQNFNYGEYLEGFDRVSIRDYGCRVDFPWVPCTSCLHPGFEQTYTCIHKVVIFSHRKFQINLKGLPRLTHETNNLQTVLNFLGSGETILTSSYHGAYWGTLLGRKVLMIPFNSKFYLFKHLPGLYPVDRWRPKSRSLRLFGKTLFESVDPNQFTCPLDSWPDFLATCSPYPDSLSDCRQANQQFYQQILTLLGNT